MAVTYLSSDFEYLQKDTDYAMDLLTERIEHNYAEAYNSLGLIYWRNENVERDIKKATDYFDSAIQLDNTDAMVNLAVLYIEEYEDYERAFSLLTRASDAGNYDAMYCLATMYDRGNGVEPDLTKALNLMLKAAEAYQPDAMASIGYYYVCNDLTLDTGYKWRDVGTGLYWLSEAKFAGSAAASYYWGLIFKGEIDVSDSEYADTNYKKNEEKAFSYMMESAEKGYQLAMSEVSNMYETGYGTKKNPEATQEWKKRAIVGKYDSRHD